MNALFDISGWEHVGIRVSDRDEALAFYSKLGFVVDLDDTNGPDSPAIELINKAGVRIHLIINALPGSQTGNILQDRDDRYAGVTHPAFTVAHLDEAVAAVQREGIKITEGPKEAERRKYFFIRDPDGTVLEFNELSSA